MNAPSDNSNGGSIDALVDQLRRRVAERRAAGDYPEDLERDLDAHFARIATHRRGGYDFDGLRAKILALEAAGAFDPNQISNATRLPGGSFVHRALAKVVRRQTEGVLAQAQRHADALREVMTEVLAALQTPAHTHVDLLGEIEAIFEKLDVYERAGTGTPALAGLLARVEALEARATNVFGPPYQSDRFDARFRGERDEILSRYRNLAGVFTDTRGPVVDVGCGRGEFVELLLEAGVDARGIDIDSELVRGCVERGLPVEYGEANTWLRSVADDGLAGLCLIQVVEHFTPQELVDFASMAIRKVRRGGRLMIETVNPQSLSTFAHAFYLDPTHQRPVHPAYLMFLLQEAGFTGVDLQWRSPVPDDDRLHPVGDETTDASMAALAKQINANNDRVNQLLFAEQDYALIAVR